MSQHRLKVQQPSMLSRKNVRFLQESQTEDNTTIRELRRHNKALEQELQDQAVGIPDPNREG